MTMGRMVELLEIEHECMLRKSHGDCDNQCDDCDLAQDDGELHEMYTNVIALLKVSEPRVMTWDEIWREKPFVMWVEDTQTGERCFRVVYIDGFYRDVAYDYVIDRNDANRAEYGKIFRCWTDHPNDALREAEPWQ